MKNQISATELRHKIDILHNVEQSQYDQTWQVKFTTFAKIFHLMPNSIKFFEGVEFGNQISQNYILFCIRFNKNIDKNMRVRLKDKQFLIKKITNLWEKNTFLELIALEIA